MWPWGHLAVGYLLYSLGLRQRGRLPQPTEAFMVAFGTLLPDIVDKPLAWTFGVLESGRSLGHSVLVAAVVLAVVYAALAPRFGRPPVVAFAVGYLSHPLADFPLEVFSGDYALAAYFVWPILSVPPPEEEISLIAYILSFELGPYDAVQFALFLAAVYLWYLDGMPGWDSFKGMFQR